MEKIFAEILEQARAEAEKTRRMAAKVAERELEYAQRDALELRKRYRTENSRELAALKEKIGVRRERETLRTELEQRQEFVGRTMGLALELFRKEGRSGASLDLYKAWLAAKAAPAAGCFSEGVKIVCPREDRELIRGLWQGPAAEFEDGTMAGGFVVSDPAGRMAVDCTLEASFRNGEEKWRDLVIKSLEE